MLLERNPLRGLSLPKEESPRRPMKDLCHLGGWKNPQAILTCYQKPDEDTMRQALESRKRLVSGGSG